MAGSGDKGSSVTVASDGDVSKSGQSNVRSKLLSMPIGGDTVLFAAVAAGDDSNSRTDEKVIIGKSSTFDDENSSLHDDDDARLLLLTPPTLNVDADATFAASGGEPKVRAGGVKRGVGSYDWQKHSESSRSNEHEKKYSDGSDGSTSISTARLAAARGRSSDD